MERRLFMRFPGNRPKAFTLSYDDGVEQDIRFIEICNKYGLKCTFNLNAGLYAPEGTVYPKGRVHRRMTREQCLAAYEGHEVATHGFTHPFLEKLSPANVCYEIIKDRESLENDFGYIIKGHAYPYGTYSDEVVECLRNCGIVYARTTRPTEKFDIPTDWLRLHPTCHHNHPRALELCDKLIEMKPTAPQLYYLWGHTYEFEGNDNWEVFEQIAQRISGKEDIWYATNIEIYNYVQAYNSLIFSADMKRVYNPTATKLYFSFSGKDFSVDPAQTIELF